MEGSCDSQNPLFSRDMSNTVHANVNHALELDESQDISEPSSLNTVPVAVDTEPSHTPGPHVPDVPLSSPVHNVEEDSQVQNNVTEKGEGSDTKPASVNVGDGTSVTQSSSTAAGPRMSHSRGASQISSCEASVGRMSSRDLCHSRGASTDGSLMDAYGSSATDSRRGT
ncbi:hypothetical protein OTU49_009465, partial [Cherax quadricarinatus]